MEWNCKAIKFYGAHDLGTGYHLKRVGEVLQSFDFERGAQTINECLELYNIKKFGDADLCLDSWTTSEIALYKERCRKIPGIVGRFLGTIGDSNVLQCYDLLNGEYEDDFWETAREYRLYERISSEKVSELLDQHPGAMWHILEHKKIVLHHGAVIATKLENNLQAAERLISCYLEAHERTVAECHFPSEFTKEKREKLLRRYVESDEANPNYLALLWQAQSSAEFPVSDKLRLKAKKQYEAVIEKLFSKSVGLEYGAEIGFMSRPDYTVEESYSGGIYHAIYGLEWLKENMDYPTLLNNFIYLFNYVDKCFRCTFMSLDAKLGVLEKHLGVKGYKDYPKGIVFDMDRMRSLLQMHSYKQELERLGVRIEEVFKWFFEVYLKDEFGAVGFSYSPPSENTTPAERCKLLAISIDGVLKQYRLFVEDGYVDRELLEMSSGHIVFNDLKSMVEKKYAYSNSRELEREQFLLYSDQSLLKYTEKTKDRHKNLPEMLTLEGMVLDDFYPYQHKSIDWLIKRGTVLQGAEGRLNANENKAFVLKDLFVNEVVCPSYYKRLKGEIESLVASGDMQYESTLFSRPEQAYLNYVLNKSTYSNGMDLRNKYSHDTCSMDENVQVQDYDELLKIMVLIIIKINEEFCLREGCTVEKKG